MHALPMSPSCLRQGLVNWTSYFYAECALIYSLLAALSADKIMFCCRFDAYMTGMCFARLMRLHEASAAGPADPVGNTHNDPYSMQILSTVVHGSFLQSH